MAGKAIPTSTNRFRNDTCPDIAESQLLYGLHSRFPAVLRRHTEKHGGASSLTLIFDLSNSFKKRHFDVVVFIEFVFDEFVEF